MINHIHSNNILHNNIPVNITQLESRQIQSPIATLQSLNEATICGSIRAAWDKLIFGLKAILKCIWSVLCYPFSKTSVNTVKTDAQKKNEFIAEVHSIINQFPIEFDKAIFLSVMARWSIKMFLQKMKYQSFF